MNRSDIERRIPHAGRMCLLDEVLERDGHSIICLTDTHRDLDNPLREDGVLPAAAALEYAAQAMALHSAGDGGAAGKGMLVAARELVLHRARLDDIEPPLSVRASLICASPAGFSYTFEVTAGNRPVAAGRATIAREAA